MEIFHVMNIMVILILIQKMIQTFFEDIHTKNVNNFDDLLIKFVNTFKRAYSLIIATDSAIYLLKDRYGVRPLCYSLENGVLEVSSESVHILQLIQNILRLNLVKY